MNIPNCYAYGRVETMSGFSASEINIACNDELVISSGAHVDYISQLGTPSTVRVYNGGSVDSILMIADVNVIVFSGGSVGSICSFNGNVTIRRGGIVSNLIQGGNTLVYSGGLISHYEGRGKLDIRSGGIVLEMNETKKTKKEDV